MKKPKPASKTSTNKSKNRIGRGWLIALALVAVSMLGGGLYNLMTHHTTTKSTTPSSSTGSSSDKQYTPPAGGSSSSTTTSQPTLSATKATLPSPSGQLLNVQTASLAGNTGLESICQAIPNASCDIKLTQGSVTKYVGAQATGSNGAVIFDWNAKGVGLATGVWSVQAIVSQNGAIGVSHIESLEVQP